MPTSYEFATGSVRVRECALLSRQDMEQLLAAPDEASLQALLMDKGYGDPADGNVTVEAMLAKRAEETWAYVMSLLPSASVMDAFLIQNDLHNAKTILKGTMADRFVRDLLMYPALVDTKDIENAVKENNFTELPEWMADPLKTAYEILAVSQDAQRADAVMDCAGMQEMIRTADDSNVPLIREIMHTKVFYANVKCALRAARTHMPDSYLDLAVFPCDGVDITVWKGAVRQGVESFLSLLTETDLYGSRDAAEAYRRSPSDFEKWVEDSEMQKARIGRDVTVGAEPLLGYFLGCEAERKAIRMIAVGIRTGQSTEVIRGRMRELYG